MTWWQYIFTVVVVLASAIAQALQFVDKSSFGESENGVAWANYIMERRLWISFGLFVFSGVGVLISLIFKPRRSRRQFRESLIDGIYEQVLDNDRTNARITIFKDVRFIRRQWYRLKDFWFLVWVKRRSVKEAWGYCRFAFYINISYRWGTEFQKSKTYFCYNSQTVDKCQGIAGRMRQLEESVTVSLPRIDKLDLSTGDVGSDDVKGYMEKGNIGSIELLKSINKPAPYIFGAFLTTNGGRKKYVLVIDSWASRTPFVDRVQRVTLPAYIKQLSAALDTRS